MSTSALQTIEVHPAGQAVASIIVLHGLGADGTDFLPFADEIDLASIGPVRWLLPRAPVRPVTVNNGYRMRAWTRTWRDRLSALIPPPGMSAAKAGVKPSDRSSKWRERLMGIAASFDGRGESKGWMWERVVSRDAASGRLDRD